MKNLKFKTVLVNIALLVVLFSCKNKHQDPLEYHNKMMVIINSSDSEMTDMNKAMQTSNYEKAKEVAVKWLKKLDSCTKEIEAMGDLNGDASYKNGVLGGLKLYKEVVGVQYPTLIKEREGLKSGIIVSQENEIKVLNLINDQLEKSANAVNTASADFEKKYKQ
jgi:hypothetical protein